MDKDELHERIMLLKEELEAGRVKIAEHLNLGDSLTRIRYGKDGKVDPESVDASVRALANAIVHLRRTEELRKIPLVDVQAAYFDFLERFFGNPYSEMKKHGVAPHDIADGMAATPSLVKAFQEESQEFASGIRDFWTQFGPVIQAHLDDLRLFKAVYGGDIFPSHTANIACSVGLYMDTIILPDPVLRVSRLFEQASPESQVYYLTKHALNAMTYKDLALAEVEPPIVVIAPQQLMVDESMHGYLAASAESDLLDHSRRLFGREFAETESLISFLDRISEPEDLVRMLADPGRLLFDTEWSEPVADQIDRYKREVLRNLNPELAEGSLGRLLYVVLFGRMLQSNATLLESSNYGGAPLLDAPTSWQYLLWKYEYDRDRMNELDPRMQNALVSKALEAQGSDELGLISGLPSEALIELRQRGALAELRQIIRHGVEEIDFAAPAALTEVTETVTRNISDALSQHRNELDELSSSSRKFFGLNVAPWIVTGGLSIAAASTGNILLAIIAATSGTLGAPTAKDVIKEARAIISRGQQLKRTPTGILFKHLKN